MSNARLYDGTRWPKLQISKLLPMNSHMPTAARVWKDSSLLRSLTHAVCLAVIRPSKSN